ncbi:MAG: glycosyltransferase family 4 protein [Verrucomicrobia bacterium]|nr:glycosyltransferase family 4 protein [Verrucomicrobiota bacterium]
MKSVLLVTDIFPPDIGGPATFIPALAAALTAQRHSVTVFCRADNPAVHAASDWPFRVLRMPRLGGLPGKLKLMAALTREVVRHDIIFSNGLEQPVEWACRATSRRYALKVVGDMAWERARIRGQTSLSVDDFQAALNLHGQILKWQRQRTSSARHARLVITPSDYLRRLVTGWGVDPQAVFTVLNGLPLDEFDRFAPRPRAGALLEVLFVGRLVNWKGVGHLLHAVAEMPDMRATIAGDGPEGPALRALAHSLGLQGRVEFCGSLPAAALRERYARADVLALPSEYEGLSHTLLEACAAALPCVAANRCGNPEVIEHERSGLLVPYGDVARLGAAIERLRDDEPFRFTLAAGAKARAREFDFRRTVSRTMELLLA